MTQLGWIGVWLLVFSILAIAVECAVAALWSVRIARKGSQLSARLAAQQAALRSDLERLLASMEDMHVLWQPYRRLLRWLRHPLMLALLQSVLRRRSSAR